MTLNDIKELLEEHGIEFFVKKEKGPLVKLHLWVEEEKVESTVLDSHVIEQEHDGMEVVG